MWGCSVVFRCCTEVFDGERAELDDDRRADDMLALLQQRAQTTPCHRLR
jgi:hypothetical protein